ncbi:hypothetical protein C2S53_010913 [Perilla frutescens var. hirtella]|uniref:DUF4219 domain-containing protein n=1 Tax=Perilla frutescens var. hirtella TaxID=608512 RepID=A0AAD4J1D1_PERFH|nr:hypothetical protein C2S53_010913 [Perilla frutescens var. hirtella]
MESAIAIPIFDGENYQAWVMQMKVYFEALDLWEAVEEDYLVPQFLNNPTFEIMKMKESEMIKDYSDKLLNIINKVRLLEESTDLSSVSLAELVSALQAVEQRKLMRKEDTVEVNATRGSSTDFHGVRMSARRVVVSLSFQDQVLHPPST